MLGHCARLAAALALLLRATELEAASVRHARRLRSLEPDLAGDRLEEESLGADSGARDREAFPELGAQRPAERLGAGQGKLLVTTGYWCIRHSKRGGREESGKVYQGCMGAVMSLNAPMALYGDAPGLEAMRAARGGTSPPAASAEVEQQRLGPCGEMADALAARGGEAGVTNRFDVPSLALGCIWDGKPGLLARSARERPGYSWHAWLDVCMGHGAVPFEHGAGPWPPPAALAQLPADRIVVSDSGQSACEDCREGWGYCHCIAGTAFVVPAGLAEPLAQNFSRAVSECLAAAPEAYVCLSDQVILTKLLLRDPERFLVVAQGYGIVATQYLTATG